MALRRLRKFAREGAPTELDLDDTIKSTAHHGYLDIKMVAERRNKVKLLVLFDIGGSMDSHIKLCEELFSAARTEFKNMEYFYFHNCLYEGLWKDNRRRHNEKMATWDVLHKFPADYKVVFVGDATMSPYEITYAGGSVEHWNEEPGAIWLERLTQIYESAVWLNPGAGAALGIHALAPDHQADHGRTHVPADAGRSRQGHAGVVTLTRTRIIRAFAWADFAVTLPFALPYVSHWLIGLIYHIDARLGFDSPVPGFDPVSLMFVNIMGVLGVVWALARIGTPSEELARLDGLGRLVVAALIIHAITWGATPVLWAFVATELAGSAAQLLRRPTKA